MLEYLTIGLLITGLLAACASGGSKPPLNFSASVNPTPPAVSYELSTQTFQDTVLDTDGTPLARYRYELPQLTVLQKDGTPFKKASSAGAMAQSVVEHFNDQFEQWYQNNDFSELVEMASEARAYSVDNQIPWNEEQYVEELTYTSWQTEHLVSIRANLYSNTGGPHPNTLLLGWNYNLDTGAFVTPTVLAEDDQIFLNNVTDEIMRQIQENADGQAQYWSNYEETVDNWTNYSVTFDKDGMTVAFSPYELAAYAAGAQAFLIPYQTLDPWLSDYGRQVLDLDTPAAKS